MASLTHDSLYGALVRADPEAIAPYHRWSLRGDPRMGRLAFWLLMALIVLCLYGGWALAQDLAAILLRWIG